MWKKNQSTASGWGVDCHQVFIAKSFQAMIHLLILAGWYWLMVYCFRTLLRSLFSYIANSINSWDKRQGSWPTSTKISCDAGPVGLWAIQFWGNNPDDGWWRVDGEQVGRLMVHLCLSISNSWINACNRSTNITAFKFSSQVSTTQTIGFKWFLPLFVMWRH